MKGLIKGRFVPAELFALLIWVQASLPGENLQRIQTAPKSPWLSTILSDPVMHFLVFGFLTIFICIGFYGKSKWSLPLGKVAVISFGYSFVIEIYQGILPWRTFGLDDLVWNAAGILFFLVLVGAARLILRKKIEQKESDQL